MFATHLCRSRPSSNSIKSAIAAMSTRSPTPGLCFAASNIGATKSRQITINSCAMVLSFIAGLPYGAVGVAVAYSAYSLVIRVPIWYLMVGRTGPVRAADLWAVFFRHLPVWIVVYSGTWLTLLLVGNFSPLPQLLICGLVGFLVGAIFICSFGSQRQVATRLWVTLQELKQNPLSPD